MATVHKARFDTRLTTQQKELFERAARLGGFKTLSDFILSSAQQQADQILEKHNQLLAGEADQQAFFRAILHPPKPNARLKKAMGRYITARPGK